MKKIIFMLTLIACSFNVSAQITPSYYEDFESGSSAWTVSTITGSAWNIVTPVNAQSHSGNYSATVGYNGSNFYLANSETYLTSSAFNFSALNNPVISFWKYHELEFGYDVLRIDYSIDSVNWNVVGSVGQGYNWYTHANIWSSGMPGWQGIDTLWKNSVIDMPSLAGIGNVYLRFAFTSDGAANQFDGCMVDDIVIDDASNFDFLSASYYYTNFSNCGFNQVNFNVWGLNAFAIGNLAAFINFGDGRDTTINFNATSNVYSIGFSHRYNYAGNFSVQYIVSDGSGNADTLNQLNVIGIPTDCGDISGRVFRDNNGNCIYNAATDSVITSFPVKLLTPLGQTLFAFTDTVGNYYFQVQQTGSYSLRIGAYQNYGYSSSCPLAGYSFISTPANNKNFALTCSPAFDLAATLSSTVSVPGQITNTYVNVSNYSCQPVSGSIEVTLDNKLSYQSAIPVPDIINGNLLLWNFTSLTGKIASITISSFTDTTATIGDMVCNYVYVTPVAGDSVPANNTFSQCRPVQTSFDPNEKTVTPEGNIDNTTELTYTVFFQNTGTATAYNIHIFDTIDSNLDLNTLRIIDYSHPCQLQVHADSRLHFAFNNILLPDSNANEPLSHGYVNYKIKPFDSIPDGTIISNTAYIYFDYNSPIVTNNTFNHIGLGLSIADNDYSTLLTIYPNPVINELAIYSKQLAVCDMIRIIDVVGKEVLKTKIDKPTSNIKLQTSNLTTGIYFVELKIVNEVYRRKFVKQ